MRMFEKENFKDAETINLFYTGTNVANAIKNIILRLKEKEIKILISPSSSIEKIRESQGAIRTLDKMLQIEANSVEFLTHYKK